MHFATQKLFSLGLMTCTNQEVIFIDIIAMGFGKSNTDFFVILCGCIYVLRKCAYRYIQHII